MSRKINEIVVEKRQICYICTSHFSVYTEEQFTTVDRLSKQYKSKFMLIAFIKCWIGTKIQINRIEQNAKYERKLKGWS